MNIKNLLKALKLVLLRKSMAPIGSFYDPKYPPTKFLKTTHRISITCIMCGFPRTGTHWIRNVIEKSSGLKTGDLYQNKPSSSDKNVVLIKIHARNKCFARVKALWLLPPFDFGDKYIYVYRDPRDAIISLYEMYKKVKGFDNLETHQFMNIYDPIRQYRWEVNAWVIPNHNNVLLVKFENLKL